MGTTVKENVFDVDRLNQLIRETKAQQDLEWIAIKDEITEIKENLKPLNLIRNTVEEINETVGFKSDLAQSAISIGIGYLAKKLVVGNTDSVFKNILGSILQLAVTTLVSKPHGASHEESSQQEPSRE
ncbi:hypothetical protein IRZ71_08340 [Flavobacterium sp. ANB]|uniref:hypothetical protein n=1 Tax=unclassified Flavobacterium TaxID=196869 RepID=UPI0012B80ECE|nr:MULTISPECIES: hypothetical protein [unclassified Flavobacterium]MBF4516348.1 hypothetical protein [Flavobacterium sp. ANB]MTD69755.1 hypothetical protein [Flavobacterium sp. LC2016-13]